MSYKAKLRKPNNGFAGSHLHHSRLFSLLAVVTLLFIFAPAAASGANTYYLDAVSGDDSYPGSGAQPWKTLVKAQSTVVSGDTVMMRNGNYGAFEHLKQNRSDWIIYKSAEGHSPEITYFIRAGYSSSTFDIYLRFEGITFTLADPTNARAITLALVRYVKFIDCTINTSGGYPWASANDHGIFIANCDNITIDNLTLDGRLWGIGPRSATNEDSNDITITNCEIMNCGQAIITSGNRWTITNNNMHDLLIDGIILNSKDTLIENNIINGILAPTVMSYEGATYDDGTKTITSAGEEEVFGVVRDDLAVSLFGDGLAMTTVSVASHTATTIVLDDPLGDDYVNVDLYQREGYHVDGIQAQKSDVDVSDLIIRRNIICNIGSTVDGDTVGGGVGIYMGYAVYDTHANITIENNLIYNMLDRAAQFFYCDPLVLRNNTFLNGTTLIRRGCYNVTASGNIFNGFGYASTEGDEITVTYEDYNILNYWGLNPAGFNPGVHTAALGSFPVGQPVAFAALFADYANSDFTLAEGSMAIDFGNPYAPDTDILGVSRSIPPDAGCYEYTGSGSSNAAPVLDSIGNKTVSENATLAFDVNASDADGDTITYSATSLPSGAALSGSSFSWTPSYTQSGTYQITFAASDGTAQDPETITITVNNVNRDPVLSSISDTSVNEIETLNLALSATDADGDTITYSSPDLPSGAVLSGSSFTWTPGYTQAGSYTVTFAASDGTAQDSEQVSITVNNVNRTVVLDEIGGKSAYADDSLDFTVSATDPDGDTIIYSASSLPTGATFASRVFSWTPADNQAGSYNVLFSASDGLLTDSETVTIVVTADGSAPAVTTRSPQADAVQVELNSLVSLHIVDSGTGVNPASVTINLNGNTIYTGDTAKYTSAYGNCYRVGTGSDYQYIYQQTSMFDFDQTVSMTVDAADLAGNQMSQNAYSFRTEMRSFGDNEQLSAAGPTETQGYSASAADNSGNIWTVWHRGSTGGRNIYVGKLPAGTEQFESPIQLTNSSADQCNAAIAVDTDDKLYVVWQDNRDGNWDIYSSTSTDGINWFAQRRVCDPNANQINPVIVLDSSSPANAYVAWQDDVSGNQDIFLAVSNNAFTTKTITQITSNSSEQTQPDITADAGNTVYVAWTDTRNGTSDIYAADSDNGPWTNTAVVTKSGDQTNPKIAAEQTGSILHLLWTDNISTNLDIYYGSSNGLPQSALTGTLITDDSSGADQSQPAIAVVGSTGNGLKVYACWKDLRNLQVSGDSDIYFVRTDSGSGTNIFIDDDSTGSNQSNPVIAINSSNQPYILWTDDRSGRTDIYYAGATYLNSTPINSGTITTASGGTVGPTLENIDSADDISVTVPAEAYSSDITVSILSIKNPPDLSTDLLSTGYEIGPSGTNFSTPVTIIIPLASSSSNGSSGLAYWLNPKTGVLSQDGISDVRKIKLSSGLWAVSFKTTHFTQFFVGEGGIGGILGGGGGGGGCSLSHDYSQAGILDFILPYTVSAAVMIALRLRDIRRRKARNI